jgi:hypothetical protein
MRFSRLAALLAVTLACAACGESGPTSTVPTGDRSAAARTSNVNAIAAPIDIAIDPGQLYIPRINVNSTILSLPTVLAPDPFLGGEVVTTFGVPPDLVRTAWWADGPEPGAPGMAVITGHSQPGPQYGVFDEIHTLVPGDAIRIESKDGALMLNYEVIQIVDKISKSDPTALQSALTNHPPDARLALLTCGGFFDPAFAASEENTIVFARAV